MKENIELQKIQVLADYYHVQFTLSLSTYITLLITFTVALWTLLSEGHLPLLVYYILLVVVGVFVYYEVKSANKRYTEDLSNIDDLLRQVENGEVLPSLSELKKMKRPKPKSLFLARLRKMLKSD